MKDLLKLSALAAVLVASATYASADSISLNSGTTTTNYVGYTLGDGSGNKFNDTSAALLLANDEGSGGAPATMSIGTGGGTWAVPITNTSWITATSLGDTSPGHVVPADGYYAFSASFNTIGNVYSGSISVLADDTVAVFDNGQLIIAPGVIGTDGRCSLATPNCSTIDTLTTFGSLTPGFNSNGANNLLFIVEQTGESAMGLDYAVSLTGVVGSSPVPEPSTLLMLGTGLIGSAGAMFRRMRRS